MTITFGAPWRDLVFMSPLSESRAARLAAFVAHEGPATVVDVGCGWAELLLQVVALSPGTSAVGIDTDPAAIAHARELAAARGVSDRVTLTTADAAHATPARADAVICIGATHAWAPPRGPDDPLHYETALTRIRALLPVGGRVVYGDGVWSVPPTPAAVAALGGRDDELLPVDEVGDVAARSGFALHSAAEASLDEWDAFEAGYTARFDRWLAEHGDAHPDATAVRARAEEQRDRYRRGYRGVLGFAYLELIAV